MAVAGALPNPLIPAAAATAEAEYLSLEHDADPTSWRRAAELWDDIEHYFVAAYCLLREAESRITSSESDRAYEPLTRAHEIATRLRSTPLLTEIESLARRARMTLDGMKPTKGGSALLTTRELEVLRLVAEGRTNSEIGSCCSSAPRPPASTCPTSCPSSESRAGSKLRDSPGTKGCSRAGSSLFKQAGAALDRVRMPTDVAC